MATSTAAQGCAIERVPQCVTSVTGYPLPKLSPRFCEMVLVSVVVAGKGLLTPPQSPVEVPDPLLLFRQGNGSLAEDCALPKATAKLHLCRHTAILHPARIALQKRRGPLGWGEELPVPAWARRHTGRYVPSSAGPAQRVPPAMPHRTERQPGAGGGAVSRQWGAPIPTKP